MPRVKKQEEKEKVKGESKIKQTYYFAVGRRKTAVARVKLTPNGTGEMTVNKEPIVKYFAGETSKQLYLLPFKVTETLNRFTLEAKIEGSGKSGQLGALMHGVSRALEKVDKDTYRPLLKKQGLLTRDSREKERVKAGLMGARKGKQSPKR